MAEDRMQAVARPPRRRWSWSLSAVRRGVRRLVARRRECSPPSATPTGADAAEVAAALEAILAAGGGADAPVAAAALSEVVHACRRALAACELERRLSALEAAADAAKP